MNNLPPLPDNLRASNGWLTEALFWDRMVIKTEETRKYKPRFTLNHDKDGYINARKSFVELGDPTGYKWAMEYLGDWMHYLALCKCKWFKEALVGWQEELRIKVQSEALDVIRKVAASDDKQAAVAARYLAEYGWEKKPSTRGRPSKAELQGELKKAVEVLSVEDEDAKRIGLVK